MDAILKQKWIDALRSGEYKQGEGQLKTEQGCYCCLGVLARVCKKRINKDGTMLVVDEKESVDTTDYPTFSSMLGDNEVVMRLANLNDNDKKTFPQIATYIEQNL